MAELKRRTNALKVEQIANQLPYLLAENVALHAYNAHLEHRASDQRDQFRYRWEPTGAGGSGRVWIIEVQSTLHERTAGQFTTAVTMVVGDTLGIGNASAYTTSDGITMRPDQSWVIDRPPSSSSSSGSGDGSSSGTREKLTFVLEIGYSQTNDELRTKAAYWLFGTTVNEVVLIKINKLDRDDLWAEIWRRSTFRTPAQIHDVVQFIEFGGRQRCTDTGQCVLEISLAAIYDGAANIPQKLRKLNGVMPIDLFPIKKVIHRHHSIF